MHFPIGTRMHYKILFEEKDGELREILYEEGWMLPNGKFIKNGEHHHFVENGNLLSLEELESKTEPYT